MEATGCHRAASGDSLALQHGQGKATTLAVVTPAHLSPPLPPPPPLLQGCSRLSWKPLMLMQSLHLKKEKQRYREE